MNDGQSSLARMLHPLDGRPKELLVVIKYTDSRARYVKVLMLQPVRRGETETVGSGREAVNITDSVADALSIRRFDPDMHRVDPHGYVLGHSASLELPISFPHRANVESPFDHIESVIISPLNQLLTQRAVEWNSRGYLVSSPDGDDSFGVDIKLKFSIV